MKSNKGFTLIETIIAMALVMIAVFVFTPIFAFSFKQISDAGIWQNVVISQRANLENQLAGRSDILSSTDNIKYPPEIVTINFNSTGNETVDIYGRIISDTLVNRTNIKSFISNIYANESNQAGAKIIVSPNTIYYNEELVGKTFTVIGVNLTFTADLAADIKIYSGLIDVTQEFDITFESLVNAIRLEVKINPPNSFYRYAPFKIIYNNKDIAWITVLSPQIIAVTNTGDFITGYNDDGDYIFAKGFENITSGSVNDIVYNFQKREYVAVGDSNLFSTFGNTLSWINNNTTNLSSNNNNYAVSVDWLNNYMIGSSYNTAAESKVLLSVKNNNYSSKSVFEAQTVEGTIYSIDAKWFDFIRTTAYVNVYNDNNEFDSEHSSAFDYILAIGHYGVKINSGNSTYYDLLYAIQNDTDWFDISINNIGGTPSNTSASAVKMTGIASGVGKYEQKPSSTIIKSAEYSIFLVCTDNGKLYGLSPESASSSMIIPFNTHWEPVIHGKNINSLKSIAYGNDKFIAVGTGANNIIIGTVKTNTSTESMIFDINLEWTEKNLDGVIFEEIKFINYKFYAVGSKDDKGVIYSSQDGTTWTEEFTTANNCKITSIAGE